MLAATLVSFTLWSFDFVGAGSNRLVLITTIVFDTFMAFNIGGNDVANSFGTSVGAGTLSMKQALMVAAVFEVSGAVLAGGEVTDTVRSGISSVGNFLIMAMIGAGLWFIGRNVIRTVGTGLTKIHPASGFAAELSAAGVVMAASVLGLPVSSTHILIGAILGVGLVNRAANWNLMKPIALAWVITLPAAAAVGAIGLVSLRAIFG